MLRLATTKTVGAAARASFTRSIATRATSLEIAEKCLEAKKVSGKSFDQIATELGLTNGYTAQLLLGQAQLKPGTKPKLAAALPTLTEKEFEMMEEAPMRGFDSEILKEPNIYRTYEAVTHYGESIKALINEKFGDGIMSAIDFFLTVGETTGKGGERRVVITMNGKFLAHVEQQAADNTAPQPPK